MERAGEAVVAILRQEHHRQCGSSDGVRPLVQDEGSHQLRRVSRAWGKKSSQQAGEHSALAWGLGGRARAVSHQTGRELVGAAQVLEWKV